MSGKHNHRRVAENTFIRYIEQIWISDIGDWVSIEKATIFPKNIEPFIAEGLIHLRVGDFVSTQIDNMSENYFGKQFCYSVPKQNIQGQEGLKIGSIVSSERSNGSTLHGVVKAIGKESIELNCNPPILKNCKTFSNITICEIREPTERELNMLDRGKSPLLKIY